jgi:hypothetical protein
MLDTRYSIRPLATVRYRSRLGHGVAQRAKPEGREQLKTQNSKLNPGVDGGELRIEN